MVVNSHHWRTCQKVIKFKLEGCPSTKWIMISFCHFNMNKLEIQKNSKWQHKNTANKQSNKDTSTFTNNRIGVIRVVITPSGSNQPMEPPCSRTFCYSVCYTTSNHQLKLPRQDFGNLYSISYVKMFIHSCGHAKPWAETTTIAVASLSYKVR